MKNVLFICESYKYNASPNGLCTGYVAEALHKKGYNVTVITFFNGKNQPEYESVNGVNVYRVDPGYIWRNIYLNEKQATPEEQKKYHQTLKLSQINGLLHAFCYPLLSQAQVKNMYKKANELYKTNKFDYVIGAYHKIPDVLAGIKLKKKHPNIKMVIHSLDAISGGWVPNVLRSSKIPMNSLKRWERYFFKNIDKLFAMESHRSYYQKKEYEKYLNKIEFLDIPLLKPRSYKIEKRSSERHMVYTGSMQKATANPQYLLKLIEYLPDVIVDFYGSMADDIKALIENHELFNKRLLIHGRVSHDEILKIQENADVLLNFGNANPNMIPCKIFEYMSAKKKIISFTHSELDSSLPYINKYPLGIIITEDDSLISENAAIIKAFINEDEDDIDENILKQMFEKNTPEYFEKQMILL